MRSCIKEGSRTCRSSMRMSIEEEPVQTTSPDMVMSVATRSRFLRSIASTEAVTSSGGRVSVRPSSLQMAAAPIHVRA